MSATYASVVSDSTSIPRYLRIEVIDKIQWAPPQTSLISALLTAALGNRAADVRGTYFLDREQQRIFRAALRRSIRIVA